MIRACHPVPRARLLACLLILAAWPAPGLAQTRVPGRALPPGRAAPKDVPPGDVSPRDLGVVHPPEHIDPGINRTPPSLPPQSTPVIHPRRLPKNRGGVHVVPK